MNCNKQNCGCALNLSFREDIPDDEKKFTCDCGKKFANGLVALVFCMFCNEKKDKNK